MKANKLPNIDLVSGKDDLRPTMKLIEINKDTIVTTNAHALVCLKTSEIFNDKFINGIKDTFYITSDNWKSINGYLELEWENGFISVIKKNVQIIIKPYDLNGSKYPNWKAIIPNKANSQNAIDEIGIDGNILSNLLKALPFKDINFIFSAKNKAIIIESLDSNIKSYGLIVPKMKNKI